MCKEFPGEVINNKNLLRNLDSEGLESGSIPLLFKQAPQLILEQVSPCRALRNSALIKLPKKMILVALINCTYSSYNPKKTDFYYSHHLTLLKVGLQTDSLDESLLFRHYRLVQS